MSEGYGTGPMKPVRPTVDVGHGQLYRCWRCQCLTWTLQLKNMKCDRAHDPDGWRRCGGDLLPAEEELASAAEAAYRVGGWQAVFEIVRVDDEKRLFWLK